MRTNGKRPPFFICSSNPQKVPLANYSQPFGQVNCNSLSPVVAIRFRRRAELLILRDLISMPSVLERRKSVFTVLA